MTEQVLNDQELIKRLRRFVYANPKRSAGALRHWIEPTPDHVEPVFNTLAAHLVILLDENAFSALLGTFSPDDASRLTLAIKSLDRKVGEIRPLLRAFYKLCKDQQPFKLSVTQLESGSPSSIQRPAKTFTQLRSLPVKTLAHLLRQEHPQAVALVIAHLGGEIGAKVLSVFSPDEQVDICRRMSALESVPPQILNEIEDALIEHLGDVDVLDETHRIDQIAALCTQLPDLGEDELFPQLDEKDAELAQEIRNHMYTFDDLIHIDDRGMQKLIGTVPRRDLVLSLKKAGYSIKAKILKNVSQRARQALLEDLELMGRVKLSEVKISQSVVIDIARKLEAEGEIINTGPLSKETYV